MYTQGIGMVEVDVAVVTVIMAIPLFHLLGFVRRDFFEAFESGSAEFADMLAFLHFW
jgi:hypothetical protein